MGLLYGTTERSFNAVGKRGSTLNRLQGNRRQPIARSGKFVRRIYLRRALDCAYAFSHRARSTKTTLLETWSIQEKVSCSPKGFVRKGNDRERERGGGGGGSRVTRDELENELAGRSTLKETHKCADLPSSVWAIDVHENAMTAQDTSVSKIHLSSARLEKSDAWPVGGHSFYDEPWPPANCHVRALT